MANSQKNKNMITKDDCFYLGKIVKTHGLKGELTIKIDADNPSAYTKMDHFFVEMNKVLTPFFVTKVTLSGDKLFISLPDVDTVDAASRYVGKEVYLPMEMLPKLKGNKFYFHELPGFSVVDDQKGDIGTVKDVLQYPTQAVIQVEFQGKEILLPIVDEVIKKLDRNKKILYITAPEGLIDMYLE